MHLPPRSKGKIEVHARQSPLARRVGPQVLAFVHTAEAGGAVLLLAAIAAMAWANSPWGESYERLFHTPAEIRIGSFSLAPPGDAQRAEPDEPASGGHAEEGPDDTGAEPGGVAVAETEGRGSGEAGGDGEAGHDESHAGPDHGMTLHHWINDILMVVFFFVVGLEIKRELVRGELQGMRRAALPAAVALGGMILPASIYVVINVLGPGGNLRGWGVPMATDIAFALGVLALLGDRVPNQIRVLLLAFAIVDDIGAILVIALFYTEQLSLLALGLAGLLVVTILLMQRIGVLDVGPYVFVGALLGACMLCSGIHATIAGVMLGLLTPARPWFSMEHYRDAMGPLVAEVDAALSRGDEEAAGVALGKIEKLTQGTEPVLDRLIRLVHPWSAFVVLPIFALSNAGVVLSGEALRAAAGSAVLWGVLLGLMIGKPLGTTGLAWLAARLGLVSLPEGTTWTQIFGIGMLGGVGFTVALFITDLAFDGPAQTEASKIAILGASLVSGIAGFLFLRLSLRPTEGAPAPGAH